MRHDQQHFFTLRCELENDFGFAEHPEGGRVGQESRRIALRDLSATFHAIDHLRVFRRRRFLVREIGVLKVEHELAADAEVHLAAGKPGCAQLRVGEILPDALDRPRQQAFEPHFAWSDDLRIVAHRLLLGFLIFARRRTWPRPRLCKICSSASSRSVQNARCLSIQAAASISGSGSNATQCSRHARRRRTNLACSSTRMCFDTALSDIANGSANSVTRASPRRSRSTIARRVGSASAASVAFNRSSGAWRHSTSWFNDNSCMNRLSIAVPFE